MLMEICQEPHQETGKGERERSESEAKPFASIFVARVSRVPRVSVTTQVNILPNEKSLHDLLRRMNACGEVRDMYRILYSAFMRHDTGRGVTF